MSDSIKEIHTFCRVCEAFCGLKAHFNPLENRVERILPDREHPVSQGYICVKGAGLGALNEDPDRLNFPARRVNGKLERIDWDTAFKEIGAKTRSIIKAHGPESVALYAGNPTFASYANTLWSTHFLKALGSHRHYASHSIDVNNKFFVSTEMYGVSLIHPIPDFKHVKFLLILGSNPAVSQMSVMTLPNALERLCEIETRGGRVVIVDPRRTETAEKLGEHIFIRPGTDVYLLAAMAHVLLRELKVDLRPFEKVADHIGDFASLWDDWTPERAAELTGIPAEKIREITRAYFQSGGGALYMSVGVNMGPFGSLAYWLLQSLNLLSGNLDRRGGLLVPRGVFNVYKLARLLGLGTHTRYRSPGGRFHVAGSLPVATLADEIMMDDAGRIRVLFVSAGNPVHSVPGDALRKALPKLELIVSIDIYPNQTSRYAHYLLPATDMLERDDYPTSHIALQAVPHAQYTPAVLTPKFERKAEWEIFSRLAVACGGRILGTGLCDFPAHWNNLIGKIAPFLLIRPRTVLRVLLAWGRVLSLRKLRRQPRGVLLPELRPGDFLGKRVLTKTGRVNLAPESLKADLPRLRHHARTLERKLQNGDAEDEFYLVGRRDRRAHNSWMFNNPHIKHPETNFLIMHPEDAAKHKLRDGDPVQVTGNQNRAGMVLRVSDEVAPGVVCAPHGWGHADTELSRAAKLKGVNINPIIPGGPEHIEPVSGQAIMTGARVLVTAMLSPPKAPV